MQAKSEFSMLLNLCKEKGFVLFLSSFFSLLCVLLQFVPYFMGYLIVCEFIIYKDDLSLIDKSYIFYCALAALLCLVLNLAFTALSFTLSHFAAFKMLYDLRLSLAKKLYQLPLGYFTTNSTAKIHQILQSDVEQIEDFIAHKIPEFLMSVGSVLLAFVLFLWADFKLAFIFLALYVLAFLVQTSLYLRPNRAFKKVFKEFYHLQTMMSLRASEFIGGIAVLKMFNKSFFGFKKLSSSLRAYKDYALRASRLSKPHYLIFNLIIHCLMLFILPFCALYLSQSPFDISFVFTVLFFIFLNQALVLNLLKILPLALSMLKLSEALFRIHDIFSQKSLSEPKIGKEPLSFDIEFKNVSFTYGSKPILKDISFHIKQGQSLAIIGESGVGKSTLLALIARFIEPINGEITIGNISIKELLQEKLMQILAFVAQDSFIFKDSLRFNIKLEQNKSDEELLKALKIAHCEDILNKFSLDDELVKLSGGQAKKIELARAILKNSPILLLDELNSHLDIINENEIFKSLNELKGHKTVIFITHKLKFALKADKILFLKDAKILAFGSHNELLNSSKDYQKLFNFYQLSQNFLLDNRS